LEEPALNDLRQHVLVGLIQTNRASGQSGPVDVRRPIAKIRRLAPSRCGEEAAQKFP
jgi:hypothetical protein